MSLPHNLGLAFTAVAQRHAHHFALRLENADPVTYAALEAMSNQLAHHLAGQGVVARDVVALVHDKSAAGYAAMLACLKLGAVYVNLDAHNPPERLRRILDTAQPRLIVTDSALPPDAPVRQARPDVPVLALDAPPGSAPTWQQASTLPPPGMSAVTGADPAYLMYTSGSTGLPKGAVIPHGAVLRFVAWISQRFAVTPSDVFSGLNPPYFDNSVFDFYGALFNGAGLAPVSRATAKDGQAAVAWLSRAGCTLWFSVPSLLIYANTVKALPANSLPALRAFIFGGEGFPKAELAKLHARFQPRVAFINVYGPTECTCICSAHAVQPEDLQDPAGLAPLGHLNPDFAGWVLDDNGVPVAPGESGELWLGGPNVGLGYYNDPQRTASSFAQHPLHVRYPERLYRTGDLVRQDSHGCLHFVGRRDNQIKHLGYRIELEEIEAALCALPGISQAGVVYRRLRPEFGQIEAFVAADPGLDPESLREALRAVLPDYMIPRRLEVLPDLPKNANGKVDRKALEGC